MAQVSWRADDELVERAKQMARRTNRSLNELLTLVVTAATDPATAGTEIEAIRERLTRAGLLEAPSARRTRRPSRAAIEAAGRRAAGGTPMDELLSTER